MYQSMPMVNLARLTKTIWFFRFVTARMKIYVNKYCKKK